jgi:hypothetical protein
LSAPGGAFGNNAKFPIPGGFLSDPAFQKKSLVIPQPLTRNWFLKKRNGKFSWCQIQGGLPGKKGLLNKKKLGRCFPKFLTPLFSGIGFLGEKQNFSPPLEKQEGGFFGPPPKKLF